MLVVLLLTAASLVSAGFAAGWWAGSSRLAQETPHSQAQCSSKRRHPSMAGHTIRVDVASQGLDAQYLEWLKETIRKRGGGNAMGEDTS